MPAPLHSVVLWRTLLAVAVDALALEPVRADDAGNRLAQARRHQKWAEAFGARERDWVVVLFGEREASVKLG